MFYFVFGLILMALQFLPIMFFKDKKQGFVYVLFFWILFQSVLAIVTQLFGVFYFWTIFFANIIAVLAVIFFVFKKIKWHETREIFGASMDEAGMILFVILVSVATLWQVHYNYTGKINLATDKTVSYHDVKNMNYSYPYFSDEWDAVSLINYSIDSHLLPMKNPLDDSTFFNFAAPFYSFLAGLVLLLKIDPLTSYNFLAIFVNLLIILLVYLFLRINKISKMVSAISALFLLYISCGANLPGIWHLIPVHLGIVFCLLSFCFMSLNKTKLAIASTLASFLFYPPLILFCGLSLVVFLLTKIDFRTQKNRKKLWYFGICFFVFLLLAYFALLLSSSQASSILLARLFYPAFVFGYIPQYMFYDVIPLFAILFFCFGIYGVWKNNKWLTVQFIFGALMWLLYLFISYRIIIDYERVVFWTSIIIIIISGFGMQKVLDYIDLKKLKFPVVKVIEICFLVFFVVNIGFYTQNNVWQKFYLVGQQNGNMLYPKSPANNYLVQDDLKLFSKISQKKFLSLPWKGLVVGVSTGNYPTVTKEGTISVGDSGTVDKFTNADCKNKTNLAKSSKLDYIYLYDFNCPGFEKIGQSSEGLSLYKVN